MKTRGAFCASSHYARLPAAFAALATCFCSLGAYAAEIADMSDVAMVMRVRSATGSATLEIPASLGVYTPATQTYAYDLTTPVALTDRSGATIATLRSVRLRVYRNENTRISLDFTVDAGAQPISVSVSPAEAWYYREGGHVAEARARAGFSLADLNNDGAYVRALGVPGTGAFLAQYNGQPPFGTPFSSLLSQVACGPGGSAGVTQNDPPTGYHPVPDAVSTFGTQTAFQLSRMDRVAVTTLFHVRVLDSVVMSLDEGNAE